MNVLSIDFDYFQKMSAFMAYTYFPSPADFNVKTALLKWGFLYTKPDIVKELNKVELMVSEYNKIKRVIELMGNINHNVPVLIVNSHGELYDFVDSNCIDADSEINIINVDMHHDVYGVTGEELSCANWATCLKEDYKNLKNIWVQNSINSKDYDNFMGNKNEEMLDLETTDLAIVDNYNFDLIFLCRSDAFLLPKLDKYFIDLCSILDLNFNKVTIEENINKPRDIQSIVNKLKEELGIDNG